MDNKFPVLDSASYLTGIVFASFFMLGLDNGFPLKGLMLSFISACLFFFIYGSVVYLWRTR